jgi:hypothetical protein
MVLIREVAVQNAEIYGYTLLKSLVIERFELFNRPYHGSLPLVSFSSQVYKLPEPMQVERESDSTITGYRPSNAHFRLVIWPACL